MVSFICIVREQKQELVDDTHTILINPLTINKKHYVSYCLIVSSFLFFVSSLSSPSFLFFVIPFSYQCMILTFCYGFSSICHLDLCLSIKTVPGLPLTVIVVITFRPPFLILTESNFGIAWMTSFSVIVLFGMSCRIPQS